LNPILLPPVEYLHSRFTLNASSTLVWKFQPRENFETDHEFLRWNTRYANKVAGLIDDGYRRVKLLGRHYLAHRIIWKMRTGEEPPNTLDHVNGRRADNRPEQLRPATFAEQNLNKGLYRNNTSGYRGVSFHARNGKWQAKVGNRYVGLFLTIEAAAAAREIVARKLFGEFYRE